MSFMMVTWWSCAFSAYPETALLSWLGRGFIKRKPRQARTIEVLIPLNNFLLWSNLVAKSYSKRIKKLIREYSAEAHERELQRELVRLDRSFNGWREGTMGSGELSYRIHEWETGPSRNLYKKYNRGEAHSNVAYAIAVGILDQAEVPEELLEALAGPISMFQDWKDRDELRLPEG